MPRAMWKGPFVDESLLKKVRKIRGGPDGGDVGHVPGYIPTIKTWSRRSVIIPDFVGLTFAIHNGHKFISVHIIDDMVGRKLGEFSPTRTYHGHGANKKVKKK